MVRFTNALFETVGAFLAWRSVLLALETPPQGVSIAMVAFSALWAVWCFPYYRAHGDKLSASVALVRAAGCLVWTVVAL